MRKKLVVLLIAFLAFITVACSKKPVIEFKFATTEVSIEVGDTYTLEYEVSEGQEVEFTLSKDGIISITGNELKGLVAGEVMVTGTVKGSDVSATIKIIVREATAPVVNVTSVSITGDNEGSTGDVINLTATVLPANSTNKTVVWTTSDGLLATVNNGVVTLIKEGVVTITATADGKSASLEINISSAFIEVETIELVGDNEGLIGNTITLAATVLPANATNKTVVWTTSDELLATVNNGTVTLLGEGLVTITATSGEITETHVINILPVEVTSVELTGDNEGFIGDTITLTATVLPVNATIKTVVWTTSDELLATVDNGTVTLLGEGLVTITATSGEIEVDHQITITKRPILAESIEITGVNNGLVGDTITLTAIVLPGDADDKEITWSVNLNSLATINNGVVTLVRKGTVLVTATIGFVSETFEITINEVSALIGEVKYGTIQAAINAANDNDEIVILNGTYSEQLVINKSNLTFVPQDDKRVTLTNKITLGSNIENIEINNFNFTLDAHIISKGPLKGFYFKNNYVYDTNLEATPYAPISRVDVKAFIQLYRLADTNVFGNIFIENNIFNNVQSDIISMDRTMVDTEVNIKFNEFRNYGISAIRFDGGYNNGTYNITNNIFENDELSAYAAINFRAMAPQAGNVQKIYIDNNVFTNIGNISLDRDGAEPRSGVITTSTFNGNTTELYIRDNEFNHTFNSVHLKGSDTNLLGVVTGNIFKDTLGYTYFENGNIATYENNTYLDRLGEVVLEERIILVVEPTYRLVNITDPVLETFEIIGHNFAEVTDKVQLTIAITPPYFILENVIWTSSDETVAIVNDGLVEFLQVGLVTITAEYEGIINTIEITITEKVAAYNQGVEYFTIQAAIDAANADDVIDINHGTFDEILLIDKPITLRGNQVKDTILTNKINIAENLENITIQQFLFTGDFQVISKGTLNGFTFENNSIYDTNLSATPYMPNSRNDVNAIIQLYRLAGTDIFGNITIENNIFNNIKSDIISMDRTMVDTEINIRNNQFLNFKIGAIRFDGGYNNGTYNISDNIFANEQKQAETAIIFRAYAPNSGVQTVNIFNNSFENIGNVDNNPTDSYPASAVIATSIFNSNPIAFNIYNNDFTNTHNTLHFRKGSGVIVDNWLVDVNNNNFKASTGYLIYEDGNFGSYVNNGYFDNLGKVIAEDKVEVINTSTETKITILQEMSEYVVIYYTYNTITMNYDIREEILTGVAGTEVIINVEPLLGYYTEFNQYGGYISADGSLIIEIYYEVFADAFTYELEFNGGNVFYATRAEMVDDWVRDYNTFAGTDYTIATLPMGSWVMTNVHTFFFNTNYRDKWLWVARYLAVVGSSTNRSSAQGLITHSSAASYSASNNNFQYAISYEVRGFMAGIKFVENANWQSSDYSENSLKNGFWSYLINANQKTEYLSNSVEELLPVNVYLENYEFMGWFDNLEFNGEPLTTVSETMKLYAKFEEKNPVAELVIENEITQLAKGNDYQLNIEILPLDAFNKNLLYFTSDVKVAVISPTGLITAINEGVVTIKVTSHNGNVVAEMDLVVNPDNDIMITFTNGYNGNINVGDTFNIDVSGFGLDYENLTYHFNVANEAVIQLTNTNEFTALAVGTTAIEVYNEETLLLSYTAIVQDELDNSRIDQLLRLLANANNPVAKGLNVITYYTASQEWSDPRHESVNLFLFDQLEIDSESHPANPVGQSSGLMSSTEFVLIHDTANLNGGLMNHGAFFANPNNPVSIHYTTGDYGVLASLPEEYVAWHAGDGTATPFTWIKTGVSATNEEVPYIDLSTDGYFTFNGQKSTVLAPKGLNGEILTRAYFTYQGPTWDIVDGEYVIGNSRFTNSQQTHGVIASFGGNRNSIGIEMNVNRDGDIIDTVQRTAKLVAYLLDKHNLPNRRVIMHNTTDGKGDPYTLNNTVYEDTWYFDRFMEHVAIERTILEQFIDAKITFSSNSELVSNTGRVVSRPKFTTEVEYTITVELDGITKSITLVSVIPGESTWSQNAGFFVPTQVWAKKGYRS